MRWRTVMMVVGAGPLAAFLAGAITLAVVAGARAQASSPAPASVTVTFTAEEVKVLHQLLDLAVKAGGLSVAGNADFLSRKISAPAPNPSPAAAPATPDK